MKVTVEVIPQLGTAVSGGGASREGGEELAALLRPFDTPRGTP